MSYPASFDSVELKFQQVALQFLRGALRCSQAASPANQASWSPVLLKFSLPNQVLKFDPRFPNCQQVLFLPQVRSAP